MQFILASKSPRRKEILGNIGLPFTVISADADENCSEKDTGRFVEEVARRKGIAVKELLIQNNTYKDDMVIISADTVVECNGEIFGKPHDKTDAYRMLSMLSDNSHYVYSGIAVTYQNKTVSAFEKTAVSFKKMSETDINFYIESEEPFDKAGAYAIQGLASVWIEKIDGCYFNVVGLPLNRLSLLLKDSFGIDLVKYIKYSK